MEGHYSDLRLYVQEKNPRTLYVWCFSHVLNLVVVDIYFVTNALV